MTRFVRSGQVTLDSAGEGQVTIGCPSGARWKVETTTTSTTSTTRTTASLYLGSPSPAAFLEGTYAGNRDTSNTVHQVLGGEILTCTWSGGDAGATATLRVAGEQQGG